MESNVVAHTYWLLHQGIFNNLTDQQLSLLYIKLLRPQTEKQQIDLLQHWYQGNFRLSPKALRIVAVTNELLSFYGMPIISVTNFSKE